MTDRRCIVEGENHSTDLVTVFHGHTEPATACGFHATYYPQLVFLAHNESIRQGQAS